ncbi:MAG: isoprenylcysteine carboxylmethyltransferase family protein [Anaerolineales bacterium]|nr:isoprenylcysteine carboxylmethyltransferase family protein [Anaerolineales bacterium]
MAEQQQLLSPRLIIQLLFYLIVIPFLPLLISWHWGWWEAWVYAILYILGFAVSRRLAARRHPDLIAERAQTTQHEDAKPWDRVLSPIVALGIGVVLLIVGLDALLGWSRGFRQAIEIAALALMLAGYVWSSYALIENRFFSGVVRLQTERGHHVVSSGPYRWMRHPGYAGALLAYLSTPFFLDSAWAIIPALLLAVAMVIRTHLEDSTLQQELPGYAEYAQRVRYRLMPGVW